MKKFYLLLILLFISSCVQAKVVDYAKDGFPPLAPVNPKVNTVYSQNTDERIIAGKNLSRMEKRVFNKSYDNDVFENRIARLEEQVMGTIQDGALASRYNNLQKAVYAYINNTPRTNSNMYSQYYSSPIIRTGGGWRGLAGSLGNFFSGAYSGYPTGLSPQIYSPYINNYGPDYQRGYYTNNRWNYHNTNYGNSSGVHILGY